MTVYAPPKVRSPLLRPDQNKVAREAFVIPGSTAPGAACAAGIHCGGHAAWQAGHIRINGAGPASVEKVAVDVHQAGRDQMSADVDHFPSRVNRQIGGQCRHAAIAKRDVRRLAQVLGGINHIPAFEKKIVLLSHTRLLCQDGAGCRIFIAVRST